MATPLVHVAAVVHVYDTECPQLIHEQGVCGAQQIDGGWEL